MGPTKHDVALALQEYIDAAIGEAGLANEATADDFAAPAIKSMRKDVTAFLNMSWELLQAAKISAFDAGSDFWLVRNRDMRYAHKIKLGTNVPAKNALVHMIQGAFSPSRIYAKGSKLYVRRERY